MTGASRADRGKDRGASIVRAEHEARDDNAKLAFGSEPIAADP